MSKPPVTPEQLAALPPKFRTLLHSVIDHYERRIAALEAEIARLKKSPQNSSLPPSVQHPHAKPPTEKPASKPVAAATPKTSPTKRAAPAKKSAATGSRSKKRAE